MEKGTGFGSDQPHGYLQKVTNERKSDLWRWRSPKLTRLCSPEVIHTAEGPLDFLSKQECLCSE
jgi:hypothetical protein